MLPGVVYGDGFFNQEYYNFRQNYLHLSGGDAASPAPLLPVAIGVGGLGVLLQALIIPKLAL